jgi:hypothetical protein
MRLVLALVGIAVALGEAGVSQAAAEPNTLEQARALAAEVSAQYRTSVRPIRISEVTSTNVVESLTLVTSLIELPRVAPAANGVYFALCAVGARCPYPPRRAAWSVRARLPRAIALELALRTLRETTFNLVVVALPTAQPAWFVLERLELNVALDERDPTASRLYRPVSLEPVSDTRTTLVAVRIAAHG